MQTGGGPSRPGGEGRQCCSSRRPGARAAGSASLPGPTQKLVATNRRPRVPLAASGGVGGRARGRGRLADAAANWWADPESPRKRGRLSAVRQARLCGSGSPLLQRSPWQSRSVSAQPSRAPRAVNCSPRPLASARLPRGPAALNSIKPPQPRVPPRPVSICQSSGLFAQLWPELGHGPGGVRGRGGADRCGEPEREERAARSRWRGSAERLCSVPAVSPVRAASPGPDESPLQTSSQITSFPFILFCGGGGGEGRWRREAALD